MEEVTSEHKKRELVEMNTCRLYLRVITVSDITEIDSTTIKESFWNTPSPQESTLQWTIIEQSPEELWKTWRKLVRHTYLERKELLVPLGKWYDTERHLLHQFNFRPEYGDIIKCVGRKKLRYTNAGKSKRMYT